MTEARCPRCAAVLGGGGVCGACLLEGGEGPVMLGGLELEDPIGEGGMGQVYRARHARLGRTVAVKLLPAALADNEDFRRRFEREAQALARLAHPGIVAVHDFGEEDGQYYLVMEFAPGGTIARLMPMAPERAIALGVEIAEALAYAHAHGIVHRDLKPANVLLAEDGHALLTDFGVARFIGPHSGGWTVTQPDRVAGTPHYMAPEVIDGAAPDPRQDQYALGVVLYEMVMGTRPMGDFAPLGGALDAVVRRMLAPDPARRYGSAAEVAQVLRGLLARGAADAGAPAAGPLTRAGLVDAVADAASPAAGPLTRAGPVPELGDEELLWRQGVAVVLTVCTAAVLWALVLCVTPRVIAPGDAMPLIMVEDAVRLPDGRIVSWARFEIGPLLGAFAAVGLAVVACRGLEIHWRRAGLAVAAPERPVAEAWVVLGLGVFAVALYGTRRGFEAFGYIGIFRYMPIFGGLVEVAVVWFTWSVLLELRRRGRALLAERALWVGLALALVPPTTDLVRWLTRWTP